MSILIIFSTAFLVGLSGAMMPGPMLTFTISETVQRGFRAAPQIVLGHGILELVLILALVQGFSKYLTKTNVSHTIALLGGLFLLYTGYTIVKDTLKERVTISTFNSKSDHVSRLNPVIGGALVSLSNPYWSIWWATIGLGYITLSLKKGVLGLTSFFSGHILSDLLWYCFIAMAVTSSRRYLNDSVYRGILIICGIFLIGLGFYFIRFGITG